jgi:hypothetical protein
MYTYSKNESKYFINLDRQNGLAERIAGGPIRRFFYFQEIMMEDRM